MPTNIATTKKMIAYAKLHGLEIPRGITLTPIWGDGKRTLAWRVSLHMHDDHKKNLPISAIKTRALVEQLFPNLQKPLRIIQHDWDWNGRLSSRIGKPSFVIWHNMAGEGTAEAIHSYHKSLGWLGIAYHFFVTLDGQVHEGRQEWAYGGHTLNYGSAIGVCFEGNYDSRKTMPMAQLNAGKALHNYLHKKYDAADRRHRDMPGNSTSCPGKYFPFSAITG